MSAGPAERAGEPAQESLVEVACALCGALGRRERFREPPFAVLECLRCGHVYVSPQVAPERLVEEVYDATYWRSGAPRSRGYRDYAADYELYRATFAARLALLAPHLGSPGQGDGRALDVGCAAGAGVAALADLGWDAEGLEPSRSIASVARERAGADRVHVGRIEDEAVAPGPYDLVTLWDVVEHLPDPVRGLQSARQRLAPGGRLVLETQDVASPTARLLGRRWHHYKHREHLHHFHRETLALALETAGLRPVVWTKRRAGKRVRLDFVVERAGRVSRLLERALAPLLRAGNPTVYVNPRDEWIVVAEEA